MGEEGVVRPGRRDRRQGSHLGTVSVPLHTFVTDPDVREMVIHLHQDMQWVVEEAYLLANLIMVIATEQDQPLVIPLPDKRLFMSCLDCVWGANRGASAAWLGNQLVA
jgi:hypothetical protein